MFRTCRTSLLLLCVTLAPAALRAEGSPPQSDRPPGALAKGPASLTAKIGNIAIRIDGPKLWTLSRIEFGGTLLGVEESAYGTAINIRDVGFLGSAHKLDVPGRPGEIEAEEVTTLRFFIDNRPIAVNADTMHVSGMRFRMERESRIRSFSLQTTLFVGDDQIRETVRVRTDKAVDLKVLYPCMYAWTPSATTYLYAADDGTQTTGEFHDKPSSTPRYITLKRGRWVATYDPSSRKGTVSSIAAVPKEREVWLMFADAPEVYRKLYLVSFSDGEVPQGFDGTYSIVTGFFSAKVDEWQVKAAKQAVQLNRAAN